MDKKEIAAFFDRCAPTWDAELVRPEAVIAQIMDNAGVQTGIDVLDVACGTGVLFPDYLARSVRSLTAVDLSPEMVKIAREKFPQVKVLCADVEEMQFEQRFDLIMVYNAFPHFPKPERLIARLASLLKPRGCLSIAHSMSREKLLSHHAGSASKVSIDLLHEQELATLMGRHCAVETVISNEEMYQVCGRRAK